MEVGRDERCVPNNRMAVCSKILKCQRSARISSDGGRRSCAAERRTEPQRHDKSIEPWQPYRINSPLLSLPWWQKGDFAAWRERRHIEPPRLSSRARPHANCGGACVRGGQVEWKRLLLWNRERYLEWEADEDKTRDLLGKDVAILRHRSGAQKGLPLPLRAFREAIEGNHQGRIAVWTPRTSAHVGAILGPRPGRDP